MVKTYNCSCNRTCIFGDAATFIKDCRVLFGDIFIVPFLGSALGLTAMCSLGWGFDCLCWPWGRAFDWSCSPRVGDIWIFLRPTWRYLTADSHEKDWGRTCVSRFYASRTRHTVWKDREVMEANESKRRLSEFHCFVFKFRLFSRVFDQLNLLKYCGIKVKGSKEKPSRFLQVQLISVWLVRYNHW